MCYFIAKYGMRFQLPVDREMFENQQNVHLSTNFGVFKLRMKFIKMEFQTKDTSLDELICKQHTFIWLQLNGLEFCCFFFFFLYCDPEFGMDMTKRTK